jgi:hypothetical protein
MILEIFQEASGALRFGSPCPSKSLAALLLFGISSYGIIRSSDLGRPPSDQSYLSIVLMEHIISHASHDDNSIWKEFLRHHGK